MKAKQTLGLCIRQETDRLFDRAKYHHDQNRKTHDVDQLYRRSFLREAEKHGLAYQLVATKVEERAKGEASRFLDVAQKKMTSIKLGKFAARTKAQLAELEAAADNLSLFLYFAHCCETTIHLPDEVEDAWIDLAAVFFARGGDSLSEALKEATAFTNKYPENKRPQPWMIKALILDTQKKPGAEEAYGAARERWDALGPSQRKNEEIGTMLTMRKLSSQFPQASANRSRGTPSRPSKRPRTDEQAASSSSGTSGTAAAMVDTELEAFVKLRIASMRSRIAKKLKHLDEGLSEKAAILYESANEFIESWSEDAISEEDLIDLWERQEGLCALTGEPMSTETNSPDVGSVDRKDSRRGYTADNVQWVRAWVNYMKSSMPEGLFFKRCIEIGNRYTAWSMSKMDDMEQELRALKRPRDEEEKGKEEEEGA